jgi:hypothetical protein
VRADHQREAPCLKIKAMNDNILKEIGRSYIVSAFLPAAIFMLLGFFLFRGFVPQDVSDQLLNSKSFVNFEWLILTLLVFWGAFYLYSANDITVKIFEGYLFPKRLVGYLIRRQEKNWEQNNLPYFNRWKNENTKMMKKIKSGKEVTENEMEKDVTNLLRAHEELADFGFHSPLDKEHLMPTRLGNVLRASEMYAYERYAIEEITIWPRLVPVLPAELIGHIDEKNNQFMFLINSAFLAYCNGLLSLLFGVIGLPLIFFPNLIKPLALKVQGLFYIGYDFINPIGFLVVSALLFGFGYVLYLVAVNVAGEFGMYIRASFDLYRLNLLRQLNWPPPKTILEEQELWRNISRFIVAAERLGEVEFPEFQYEKGQVSAEKPKTGISRRGKK